MADPYLEILRHMTPEQKLDTARGLRDTAWELTAAGIRMREPELAEVEVQERVRLVFLSAVS